MTRAAAPLPDPLIGPTEAEWKAMSPAERERYLVQVNDALTPDPAQMMGEGRRHKKAKTRTIDALGLHFRSIGRDVYLAEEMSVIYPGERPFSPDVLAVLDVVEPEDDPRMAWVVADEGRGLDLVIEVLYLGDREKDLVTNVERYARLGITEYFVYDRLQQRIQGHRLQDPDKRRYRPIVPQLGRLSSTVLGLDMAIRGGELRFFYGQAELPGTADLIGRLNHMLAEAGARAEQVQAQLGEAEAQVRAAQAQALAALREGITAVLSARDIPCSEETTARLAQCVDVETLQRWMRRAATATAAEDIFSD